jgi:hypothetical protein
MEFVIWNKIEPDKIDVVLTDDSITISIDGQPFWNKPVTNEADVKIYEEILDDIEKVNEKYIAGEEEAFQKLSEEFLEKLKVL